MLLSRKLNNNFDFFFDKAKSLLFLKGSFGIFVLQLCSFFFFKETNNCLSFFFNKKFFFNSFLGHFLYLYKKLYFLSFYKFKLRGLGYRMKFLSHRLVRFFIGTTNYYFFHVPLSILVKVKRRKMFLMSNDKSFLTNVFLGLLSLKKIIPYKLRGFFFPRQIILMKPGKKRF